MKKATLLIGLLVFFLLSVSAQEESFKPTGKAFVKVFSNFNSTITDGTTASEFELQRAYFGYEYKLSKEFSGKLNIDIGDPGVGKLQMTAYIKNAYIQYKTGKLAVQFGLIGTTAFKTMEKLWGNRYIEKSFQDLNKFNASADLGFSVNYGITDWLSADLIVVNGEGYKSLQADNQFLTGLGLSITPVDAITLRGYYDRMGTENTEATIAAALGYKSKKIVAAAEYNIKQNVGNTEGKDMSGASVYANYSASKKMKVFARYDMLSSIALTGETVNWNNSKDGNLLMAGLEYSPVKGLKLAPNFRYYDYSDASIASKTSLFLNCEIKF
jgi:opacity protein-like surface antigen